MKAAPTLSAAPSVRATLRACALACGLVAAAGATVVRVDDSASTVSQAVTPMRWRQLAPGRVADSTVQGDLSVAVRLNVAAWLHRQSRIYLNLAPTDGARIVANWRTAGRMLPGSVRDGGRTLVFQGTVQQPYLEDTLLISLNADGRTLERAQSLQFFFEIEVSP